MVKASSEPNNGYHIGIPEFHLDQSMTGAIDDFSFPSLLTPSSQRGTELSSFRIFGVGSKKRVRHPWNLVAREAYKKPVAVGKNFEPARRGIVHPAVQKTASLERDSRDQTSSIWKRGGNPELWSMEANEESTCDCSKMSGLESEIGSLVSTKRVVLFSKQDPKKEHAMLKEIFEPMNVGVAMFDLSGSEQRGRAIETTLRKDFAVSDFPVVFLNGAYFGNLDDVIQAEAGGQLEAIVGAVPPTYDFDLFVIGGGSGGLAAAKEASLFDKRVGVADFVDPTPLGNSWGLGGTCVNVGCIPKKLFHQAALYGDSLTAMARFGWEVTTGKHKWSTLIENVQNHVKSLNWITKIELKKRSVQYFNSYASIVDPHSIKLETPNEAARKVTTRNILIAVGTRPKYPDLPNVRELCITSDDIFSLKYPPGTTLVVGASYVGLECAGFLQGVGFDTTVLVRSRVLNGFDEQMGHLVRLRMEDRGTKFLDEYQLAKVQRVADGEPPTLRVTCKHEKRGDVLVADYNTVLLAIGRIPQLAKLGVENVGIAVDGRSGRIIGDKFERTSVRNVYVVGDALHGRPELTPVAIQAGMLLARRLFGKSREVMRYDLVPTTVFTPVEYGTVGLSEATAYDRFASAVRVYHSTFTPYDHKLDVDDVYRSYAKIVCVRCPKNWQLTDPVEELTGSEATSERVIGFHLLSPSAGEVTQGFGVAMRMGLTLEDLESSVGIHPTVAEIFLRLKVKLEGDLGEEAACCS